MQLTEEQEQEFKKAAELLLEQRKSAYLTAQPIYDSDGDSERKKQHLEKLLGGNRLVEEQYVCDIIKI